MLKKWLGLIYILILIFTTGQQVMAGLNEMLPVISPVYGEVVAINSDSVTIHCKEGNRIFKIKPTTRIFCNGMLSTWEALLPVTSNAFFEAEILIDALGDVKSINGYYQGGEFIIQSWRVNNAANIELVLIDPEEEEEIKVSVADRARIPFGSKWLRRDQVVYVLFNIHGEIRAVYLPD